MSNSEPDYVWTKKDFPSLEYNIINCGCCGRNHPEIAGDCRMWLTCDRCGDAHYNNFTGKLVGPCFPYEDVTFKKEQE